MTEELKTLKDLMIGQIDIGYMDIIRISDLKAEAIKWVKELSKVKIVYNRDIGWIKNFFNLTEEDLK